MAIAAAAVAAFGVLFMAQSSANATRDAIERMRVALKDDIVSLKTQVESVRVEMKGDIGTTNVRIDHTNAEIIRVYEALADIGRVAARSMPSPLTWHDWWVPATPAAAHRSASQATTEPSALDRRGYYIRK